MDVTRRSFLEGFASGALTLAAGVVHAQAAMPDLSHLTPEQRAKYEAMHARMMAALDYERVTVPGTRALAEWEQLKTAGRGWPVVIGNDDDLDRIAEQFSMNDPSVSGASIPGARLRSPAEILTAAEKIDFPADLRNWSGAYQPADLQAPLGDWPSKVEGGSLGLSIATNIVSGDFYDKVHILLVPAKFGWEVPAYLRWGDWNACPPPEYHVAALRKWHEQYGTELAGINGDTMNLRAARPLEHRDQALALAREQYSYCPDIVDQGVGSISALAACLMAERWWYLWWD